MRNTGTRTQGTFGEIPKVACDQLSVVRSCAYHLLNMINMERDMLKMLNGGDGELTSGMTQIANPIEEVRWCMGDVLMQHQACTC